MLYGGIGGIEASSAQDVSNALCTYVCMKLCTKTNKTVIIAVPHPQTSPASP